MPVEQCYHCHEPIPKNADFHLKSSDGSQQVFCCPACLAISQTIQGAGLGQYYRQRTETPPIPERYDFSIWDDPNLQIDFVRREENLEAILYIEGMHCTACAWLIEKHLQKQLPEASARVNYQQQALHITSSNNELAISSIMSHVADIGYTPHPYQADNIANIEQQQHKKLLKRIGITAILMMQIGMFSIGLYAGDFLGISAEYQHLLSLCSLLFAIPLLYYSVLPFLTAAILKLKQKQLSMDVSISIAIIGLFSSSVYSVLNKQGDIYFDSIAMLCLFILTARYIEQKSRSSLHFPAKTLPAIVTKVSDGKLTKTPSNDISIGDIILIKSGETIAFDGIVIEGSSTVSEAFIRGESKPLEKHINSMVYAGSQNHDSQFQLKVSALAQQSLIKNIERLAFDAGQNKPTWITITDTIAGYFTLAIITLASATYLFWLTQDNPNAFWIALSVLVVSCPCALSLAAPTALSAAQFHLRKNGIIIQSAQVMESLNSIDTVLFDKTGTLTLGQYRISQTQVLAHSAEHCLAIAGALEAHSSHPVAQAFPNQYLNAKDVHIINNSGISGIVDGKSYRIGKPDYCKQWHGNIAQPDSELQWIGLCDETQMLAWFAIDDNLRSDAKDTTDWLQSQNLSLEILSGDSSDQVQSIASYLKLPFSKDVSSEDKLSHLKSLQKSHHVAMVGDGINDAPVLSQSHVSITFAGACDWVKNTADIILLNSQLDSIKQCFITAKRYRGILTQNFAWALLYNAIAIPFAMSGMVTPYIAALGMSLSSIIVVLNARRLV